MSKVSIFASLVVALALAACKPDPEPGPEPLIDDPELAGLVEIIECKTSQEHDLSFVQVFADPHSAALYQTCVVEQDCSEPFPPGSLFVKREYKLPDCVELRGYTVSLKRDADEYPDGRDWHWQALDEELVVTQDGAPTSCVACHEHSCNPPAGYDLRCLPE
jgi:hypothetical protein